MFVVVRVGVGLTVVGNLLVVLDRLWSRKVSIGQFDKSIAAGDGLCARILTILPVVDQALGPSLLSKNRRRDADNLEMGGPWTSSRFLAQGLGNPMGG